VKLYVNGSSGSTYVYQNTGTLGTNTKDSQADLTIGAVHQPNSSDWSDFLNGNVDDIRIYNRALSATEVLNLYLAPN
ncbi:MAG: sialidase domain-containing protein, partial [Ignavibacteriaceae bacterium]|nr:sialidase domain-containing protein [Ignavibacteriaceae bacterium]